MKKANDKKHGLLFFIVSIPRYYWNAFVYISYMVYLPFKYICKGFIWTSYGIYRLLTFPIRAIIESIKNSKDVPKAEERMRLKEEKALYINLYIGTKITEPVSLSMSVDHKKQEAIIKINEDCDYKLFFRVPYWAENGMKIECNGQTVAKATKPEGYLSPDISLKKGDVLTISYPYSVRLEVTPDLLDSTEVASVCYGPFVMTTLSDSEDWIDIYSLPTPSESFTSDWDEENGWPTLTGYGRKYIPMYAAHNVKYHTYFKLHRI